MPPSTNANNATINTNDFITYIFHDFNAVSHFISDLSPSVYSNTTSTISGFDLYLVEQWVIDRKIGTVAATFTGNSSSSIPVRKLTLPRKQSKYYPPKFQEYLNELVLNHVKIKSIENKKNNDNYTENGTVSGAKSANVTSNGVYKEGLGFSAGHGGYNGASTGSSGDLLGEGTNLQKSDLALSVSAEVPKYGSDKLKFEQLKRENPVGHKAANSISSLPIADNVSTLASSSSPDPLQPSYRRAKASPPTKSFSSSIEEVGFVTSLASLQSNLNLIPINDAQNVYSEFIINSNLKKLQCSGRSISLVSSTISDAHADKFRQIYKIVNNNVPVKFAIRELINLIQTILFYFDLLDPKYIDGLLCSKTEEAINSWWNLIGLPHFNFKPNSKSGILPSTSVSAMISLILSVRKRLIRVGGCDVPKDCFDFEYFMMSIGLFQKQFKLEKTRKLDLVTLNKLYKVTNKHQNQGFNDYGNNNIDFGTTPDIHSSSSNSNTPTASSKKSRHYYSKELKKLTSVVKSTVQDHINAAGGRDDDDLVNSRSGEKFRNKIAKYSETHNSFDVETLDLESLVKNHITGKTLSKLFYGIKNNTVNDSNNFLSVHNNHLNKSPRQQKYKNLRSSANLKFNDEYTFVSLKDKISQSKDAITDSESSRYSRGLNKVRLGRSKKTNSSIKLFNDGKLSNEVTKGLNDEDALISHTLLDSLLQMPCEKNNQADDECVEPKCTTQIETHSNLLQFNLHRRNSYPFPSNHFDLNEPKDGDTATEVLDVVTKGRQRSKSSSEINEYLTIFRSEPLENIAKFSNVYLNTTRNRIDHENVRTHYKTDINGLLKSRYTDLNFELQKLNNAHSQMSSNKKKVMDEDLSQNLQHQMKSLNSTVDRLIYETRVVHKRVSELERASNQFISNVGQESAKLDAIIQTLLASKKFAQHFSDQERAELRLKLIGTEENPRNIENSTFDDQEGGIFSLLIVYVYYVLHYFSTLLSFDRSNMNLDRIRNVWMQLDPNRKVINRAYNIIGKTPASTTAKSDVKDREIEHI